METASIAVLDFAAKYKDDLMYNRYQAGRNTIAKYKSEPPYAYVIPQSQRDPVAGVNGDGLLRGFGGELHDDTGDG